MTVYLVSATHSAGFDMAVKQGWIALSSMRFATPAKNDVWLVTRISELLPQPGRTLMIKGPDYDAGPPESDPIAHRAWFGRDDTGGQRAEFDAFVASGRGRWVSGDDEIPVNRGVEYGVGQASEPQF